MMDSRQRNKFSDESSLKKCARLAENERFVDTFSVRGWFPGSSYLCTGCWKPECMIMPEFVGSTAYLEINFLAVA